MIHDLSKAEELSVPLIPNGTRLHPKPEWKCKITCPRDKGKWCGLECEYTTDDLVEICYNNLYHKDKVCAVCPGCGFCFDLANPPNFLGNIPEYSEYQYNHGEAYSNRQLKKIKEEAVAKQQQSLASIEESFPNVRQLQNMAYGFLLVLSFICGIAFITYWELFNRPRM